MRNSNSRIPDNTAFKSPSGSRTKVKYEGRFNGKHGTVVPVGVVDTQDIINSYAPLTDINFMLHRLSRGDSSVLSCRSPMYGDFSGLPSDPIDAINMVENAKSSFGHMPLEDRQKYNNDYRVWLADLFSGSAKPSNDPHDPATGNISSSVNNNTSVSVVEV